MELKVEPAKRAGLTSPVEVVRVERARRERRQDLAATEEPLEVRLHGRPFAVIMRTPGDDRALAAGFLLSEGVIRSRDDLERVEPCRPGAAAPCNAIDVRLTDTSRLASLLGDRRRVAANASCGMCGRRTIASLRSRRAPITGACAISTARIAELPGHLRARQRGFDDTGGLHAAALFAANGGCDEVAEDVGRHNAVDKIVGRRLLADALPLFDRVLLVSGRASFEIVQKAFFAGVPIVAAVSAPSSLAIDLAREAGITLLGFVRNGAFNVYSHPDRVG